MVLFPLAHPRLRAAQRRYTSLPADPGHQSVAGSPVPPGVLLIHPVALERCTPYQYSTAESTYVGCAPVFLSATPYGAGHWPGNRAGLYSRFPGWRRLGADEYGLQVLDAALALYGHRGRIGSAAPVAATRWPGAARLDGGAGSATTLLLDLPDGRHVVAYSGSPALDRYTTPCRQRKLYAHPRRLCFCTSLVSRRRPGHHVA